MFQSEIAEIRQQIQAEYEAAQQGLSGLASGTTRHAYIQARTENIGKCHEKLVKLVGADQAISIIANTIWSSSNQSAKQPEKRAQ